MNCKITREKLLLFLEGSLPTREMKALNEHIGSCSDCQKHILEVESLSRKIGTHLTNKAESYVPQSLLWGKILSKIQAEKAKSKKKYPVWGKVAIVITASVLLLLVSTFAPVFGSEGNLLNVISSGIINNAVNKMAAMFTNDLTGQVLSAATESQLKANLGVSEADIIYLKQNGFSTKDVILAATISAKSGKSVEEIITMRKDDWGWGRIANTAGISVLSVGNQVGAPINETTQTVKNTEDFAIDLDIASTGSQVVIPDFKETITLPTDIPITDEFGNTVTADQASNTGHARLRFRIKNGKAEPVGIEAKHTLPDKFVFKGKVRFINGNSIVILVDDSEKTVSISDALTYIDGEILAGDFARVQGVVVREKMIAKYIKVIPGNTSADMSNPADGDKSSDTGNANDTKSSDASDSKTDNDGKDKPKTGDNNESKISDPQNPAIATLSGYDTGNLSTNIGKFKLTRETKVLLKVKSLTPYVIHPNAIQAIKIGAKLKITKNEDGDVKEIFIYSDDCNNAAGYIFKVDPRNSLITIITRDGNSQRFTADELIFQNYTRVQNKAGKELDLSALKPGDFITYIENGKGVLLMIRFDSMNPFNRVGMVKEITDDSVTITNESETFTFKTFQKTEWKQEVPINLISMSIPKEAIQKGTPVQIFGINIGGNYIAYMVTKKPPPPPKRPLEKMFQVIYISKTEGTQDYELKLKNMENEGEVVILVRIGVTKVQLPLGRGEFKPGKIEDIKKGIMVSFFIKDQSSKVAERITIHPKQP